MAGDLESRPPTEEDFISLCRALNQAGAKYVVADEITVDLLVRASSLNYADLIANSRVENLDGVDIPFASHEDLWRMKRNTHREKDRGDLYFLKEWFAARGIQPPSD